MKGFWREVGFNQQSLHDAYLALARRQIKFDKASKAIKSGDEMSTMLSKLLLDDNIPNAMKLRAIRAVLQWQKVTE